ncbi:serine-threonine protein kinase [Bifidobacterium sp. GSD1FS]|uniref:Serine-threonine protein kinase n=2 Tax=Bifidobacterium canis TaxID=2610880 RepID=A0A7K1J3N1_9BIFI|nr:serine-threonine protein kinase [Bifidobacterium canis]
MRYCMNCGQPLPEGATVCGNCGYPVQGTPEDTVTMPSESHAANSSVQSSSANPLIYSETPTAVIHMPSLDNSAQNSTQPAGQPSPVLPPQNTVFPSAPLPPAGNSGGIGSGAPDGGTQQSANKPSRKRVWIIVTAIVVVLALIGGGVFWYVSSRRKSEVAAAQSACQQAVDALNTQTEENAAKVEEAATLAKTSNSEVTDASTVKQLKSALDKYQKITGDKSGLSCPASASAEALRQVTSRAQSWRESQASDFKSLETAMNAVQSSKEQKAKKTAEEEAAKKKAEQQKAEQESAQASESAGTESQQQSTQGQTGGQTDGNSSAGQSAGSSATQTYANSRYGFTVTVPGDFAAQPESDNGDGKEFVNSSLNMTITAAAMHTTLTPQQYFDQTYRDRYNVSYSLVDGDVVVASWKDGSTIHYVRNILREGVVYSVSFEYPESNKPQCDPILEAVAPTLTPPAHATGL